MSPDWDVVIVGAGPAGSTAALAALRERPDARVLLLDRSCFPRDKVCGDGVAPHAVDVLARLGVDPAALVAGSRPIERLRLRSPGGVEAARTFARPAWVVPRLTFDDRLVSAAVAAGAVLRQHRVRRVLHRDGYVLVDGISARVVIGADGAESAVRRASGAPPPRHGTVALAMRGYVRSPVAAEQLITMTRSHWPAYAWVFPIGDGSANVGYGELLRDRPPSRAGFEQRLRALLPAELHPEWLRGHRLPLTPGRPVAGRGRILLTGDAASLINPLTGEGIYYAVLSGALAGRAAFSSRPARAYRRALARHLGLHLRTTDLLARLGREPRLLDLAVGAARDDQRAFDSLVEIGLGDGFAGPGIARGLAVNAARAAVTGAANATRAVTRIG